jgi:hypothetical protein
MKLKDYPNQQISIRKLVLQIPDNVFEDEKYTGLPSKEVIPWAPFSGPDGFWVKTPTTKNRMFPLSGRMFNEVLEWEVLREI